MEALIVLLPLFGALLAMPIGRMAGPRATELTTIFLVAIACVLAWITFFDVMNNHTTGVVKIFSWIVSGELKADWSVRIDTLSAVMMVVVTSVATLVHIYSVGYMHEDKSRPRFFAYLSLFTFAMLTLVTADNFLQLFFGWEGVGLASYLLIGFWHHKKSANDAAIKAFVVNRVGDFGFALGILAIFFVFRSLEFDPVLDAVRNNALVMPYGFSEAVHVQDLLLGFGNWQFDALTLIGVLLFIGAMGKSAQFLLHTWLPDAMEGPTPVSALIHAATMVTAGVFLVSRFSPIYEAAPIAAAMVTFVGATTAFFAASVGLFQNDIKRVIAYSTCSQLGYMFFAAGVGAYGAAMFHLFTHAFFKALLFLGSGAVIHALHHEQDMKKMGGIRTILPATFLFMFIGTIAITGVGIPEVRLFGAPFGTAGFVSKDMILESAFAGGEAGRAFGYYAFTLGILAAIMTSFYSWRLMFLTFYRRSRAPEHVLKHPHHVDNWMLYSLIPLAIGALFAGMAFYGKFVGKEAVAFWNGSLAIEGAKVAGSEAGHGAEPAMDAGDASHGGTVETAHTAPVEDHGAGAGEDHGDAYGHHEFPRWVLWAPFFAMIIGLLGAMSHYMRGDPLRPGVLREGGMIYAFLKNKWYFDELYRFLFLNPARWLGRFFWKKGDGKIIDGFGPDGISAITALGSRLMARLQTGYIYHYAFAMLIGIVTFLFIVGVVK